LGFKLVKVGSLVFASLGLPQGKLVIACFVAWAQTRFTHNRTRWTGCVGTHRIYF
jgi:hypothetical protein